MNPAQNLPGLCEIWNMFNCCYFFLLIFLIIIPVPYSHFAYYVIANIYDYIYMTCSPLSAISTLLFFTIFSPFSMYLRSVSQIYLCILSLLFTAPNFSFCIVGFIILSYNLTLVFFHFVLL